MFMNQSRFECLFIFPMLLVLGLAFHEEGPQSWEMSFFDSSFSNSHFPFDGNTKRNTINE